MNFSSHQSLRTLGSICSILWLLLAGGSEASAQCPTDWLPGEGRPGVTGDLPVWSLTTWDPDGAGPQREVVVAGGGFEGAGDAATFGIATWDGAEWHALGGIGTLGIPGMNDQVMAVTVYNGDLIAAGFFTNVGGVSANRIARWDGKAWHALGSGLNIHSVRALAVYNGELYAGGFFDHAGGVPATGIARWNGSSWQDVGGGLTLISPSGGIAAVFAMTIFEGKLIVGGGFTHAGGVPADDVASWDGTSWQSMSGGQNVSGVNALAVYNGALIVAANFFSPSGQFLRSTARWDPSGGTWQSMGPGPSDTVFALRQFGADLYVGGIFTGTTGGVSTPNRLARWNGSTWSSVPGGPGVPARRVLSFAQFNGALIAGGLATAADGNQTSAVGQWDGLAWQYMGGGVNDVVTAVASFQGDVYIGGTFTRAGDIPANSIARRRSDGTWDSLLGGVTGPGAFVASMAVYQDSLIVAGTFAAAGGAPVNNIARWNGRAWSVFSSTFAVNLFVHDGELYGTITPTAPSEVVQWNPLTQQWQQLGALPANVVISTLGVFKGDLVAGGIGFSGAPAAVYRWDGAAWHAMGAPMGFNPVEALVEYNGELYAGGPSDSFSGGPPGLIIKWNPATSSWQTVGGGLYSQVLQDLQPGVWDLVVSGGDLIAAGLFSHAGVPFGVQANNIVRWDGLKWSAVDEGLNNQVIDLCEHDGGLLMGGWFSRAGGAPNGYWARFGPDCAPADLNQDGHVSGLDLGILLAAWSGPLMYTPCPPLAPADLSLDCRVNGVDLAMLLAAWNP